jgi:hypothetical protein
MGIALHAIEDPFLRLPRAPWWPVCGIMRGRGFRPRPASATRSTHGSRRAPGNVTTSPSAALITTSAIALGLN